MRLLSLVLLHALALGSVVTLVRAAAPSRSPAPLVAAVGAGLVTLLVLLAVGPGS